MPVESVREVTREVMEDFIGHEMQKGNRITAINTRLRGLKVFFRFCEEREYMSDIGLKLLKEDETIKEPYLGESVVQFPSGQVFRVIADDSYDKQDYDIIGIG